MPSVVIFIANRPYRDLFIQAFAVAGWSTDRADSPIDALAVAFNADADVIVTDVSSEAGVELLSELERDEVLRDTQVVALNAAGNGAPETGLPRIDLFDLPCDPYWVVARADGHLGRETPAGIGRRPFSDEPCDAVRHVWWWTLAASDLIRRSVHISAASTHRDTVEEVAELVAHRTGAQIVVCDGTGSSYAVGDGLGWSVMPGDEDLRPEVLACIGAVAQTLCDLAEG